MCYEPLPDERTAGPGCQIDLLWKMSHLFKVQSPLWSGFMQMVHTGNHPGLSSVIFLPMIDMDPNDMNCIYSTLMFVSSHASKYNSTPVITFDQPLWWKAHIIVESQPEESPLHNVVVRLGGFHAQMSFLGSIGHLMGGSGLHELLETVYAGNTIPHILSGKAVARAVRGHFLVDSALNTILFADIFGVDISSDQLNHETDDLDEAENIEQANKENDEDEPLREIRSDIGQCNEEDNENEDLVTLTNLLEKLLSGEVSGADVEFDDLLTKYGIELRKKKDSLCDLKTARLWLQYMEMIDLLRKFLKGERMGDWELHLQCLRDMLPYFAASGHNLYLKSVYIYLQKMLKLETQHPEVYRHFLNGLHVIRRSDRAWAGLSSDLVIEQCLIRSIKTTGGLTRGRGMNEQQRLIWVLSTPACAEVNSAMQEFTGVNYTTSDQHKENSPSRLSRDLKDIQMILQYLIQRNPFSPDPSLRNISNGVTAHTNVDAYEAKSVGQKLLKSMEGAKVSDFVFKKKNRTVTMDTKSTVKIKDDEVQVDPQLLFQ